MRSFLYRLFDNSSSFAVLLKTATLTAARQLFLPNKDGTLAVTTDIGTLGTQNASSVSITGGSATGLSSVTVTGSTASVNPQTGALVVSTGGLGVGGNVHVAGETNAPVLKGNGGLISGYLLKQTRALELSSPSLPSNAIGLPANRLLNARAIYDVTSSLTGSQLDQIFDGSYDVNVSFPSGVTQIEIDFRGGLGLASTATFLYSQGIHIFYPLDGWSSASFGVEYWNGSTWTSGPSVAVSSRKIAAIVDTTFRGSIFKWRYTITTATAATGRILEAYPSDTGVNGTYQLGHNEQTDCLLTRSIAQQYIYGAGVTLADKNGNRLSIGAGTMSANNLPVYADHTAANAALTKGAYYQLTGDPALYAKP